MTTKKLTLKQRRFIEAYLETGNATESARRAGYQGTDAALRTIGWENLTKLDIKNRIEARVSDSHVTADEVIGTLASQMRSDITAVLSDNGSFDIESIRQKKLGHLIKSITIKRTVEKNIEGDEAVFVPVETIRLELHSSQSAAVQLCKVLGIEKAPADNDAAKYKQIAENLAAQFGKSVDEVMRDMVNHKPELASLLIQ